MAHRRQGYRFENDWEYERLKESAEKRWKTFITIPVNMDMKAEHRVLNLDRVKEYIKDAKIAVMDCYCRPKRQNCDAPVNVCMPLNDLAEKVLSDDSYKDRHPRRVTYDEAVDVLLKTHEAGLMHMAFGSGEDRVQGDVDGICSCCSCCCGILSGILRFGLAPHLLTGYMTSVTNSSDCTECGVCADRCQLGARKMVNGALSYNSDLCFGCGLCVSTCPNNAITLVDK